MRKKDIVAEYEGKIEGLKRKGDLLSRWIKNHQEKISISDYLKEKGFINIAVYGLNDVAILFIKELDGSGIHVNYIIDRNPGNVSYEDLDIFGLNEEFPGTDIIVVAVVEYYDQVFDELRKLTDIPLCALDDIIFSA